MDCGQCGEANRAGARFCGECGAALARRCSSCNAELGPALKFCDECGTPTSAASPAQPAAPSDATRKTVTALFADLVGSTSFGERADAEVARTVMARYHALLQEAVEVHGGTVAKFMGDGMMATFGIPEIAEDDALRAVHAGIDIQRRFTDFAATVAEQHAESLGLRVGVNTGEVVIASGDADLVGDALNVAARIEHACRPGHVTVGEDTWRLTRGEFGYEALGEVTVAGRAQPVAIYEVAVNASVVGDASAPFVGRVPEMNRLRAVLDAAVSARAARLVTVLGSPGVGKTRLSRELCAATEANDGAITFEIRCDRAGDATFAPIAQLIRDATDLGDDTDAASARERLGALLADDEADRDRLVDILGGLVGAAPSRSIEETFWAVRRLVSATAVDRPMVVVIDDIQWAEPLLLDLLEHLVEWVRDVPLLLLCLARPELREVRPSLAERNRRVEDVLALDGLDSAATEALAAGLLGTDRLPAGLVERLPASTDGNPLFVRELVRMLVDDQVIRRHGDEWELAIDADAVEVPPTIQSLLAARVERLRRDERTVLELASVIGAEFNLGALRELAGADSPVPSLLESMRRKELVEPTGTYWGDEPVHRFHHVLIRDAAYRRLLKTTRADLHEKVAVWTDAAAAGLIGEHETVIAFHYEQAYRYRAELGSVDEHGTDLGRRAAELLSAAADRALGQDDLAAAGALARRALALLPETDGTARAELLITASECTLSSGDVAGARPVVEQLRAEAGDDPTLGAWAACFEAQLVGLTDPDGLVGAEATATGAAKMMEELGDGAGEAKAHQVRAGLLARLGRVGDAELELDLALGAARRVDDRRRVTAVLGAAPLAALWGPSPVARAGGRCLDVVRLLRITTASPSVEATSMRCQAVLEALRGRFDVARSMLDSSRATLEELGLRHGLLETAYLTGVVELVAGDPAAAIAPLRDAYDGLIEMGVGIDAGRAAALLAHALVVVGRIEDAEPMAASSEDLAGQDLKTAIAWRVARAEVLAARGDVVGGITLATEAVEIAAATDLVIDHADACVSLAALHEVADETAAARAERAEAKRLYDLKGATVPSERLADEVAVAPAPISIPAPAPVPTAPLTSPGRGEAEARHDRAENLATSFATQLWDLYVAGQIDECRPLFAADAVLIDKRSIIGASFVGADAVIANLHAAAEFGCVSVLVEPLAVRGTRLGVVRITMDLGSFESVFLGLGELDANSLCCRIVTFDEPTLLDALAELDERYLAGEGALYANLIRVALAATAAVEANDWDKFSEVLAPSFVFVDHEPIGFGTGDGERFIAASNTTDELGIRSTRVNRAVHISGNALLAVQDVRHVSAQGSEYGGAGCFVVSIDQSDRISSLDYFDIDQFAAALARLDELGAAKPADPRHPRAQNEATRLVSRFSEVFVRNNVDALEEYFAEDYERYDRRTVVSAVDVHGRSEMRDSVLALFDVGIRSTRGTNLAIRGDRLALGRAAFLTEEDHEIAFLLVTEIDGDGRFLRQVHFDPDALDDAVAELDGRYLASANAAHAAVVRPSMDHVAAFNRRDWDALVATMRPNAVIGDHRGLWPPTSDRAAYLARMQSLAETAPDSTVHARKFHVDGNASLATYDVRGTSEHGDHYEYPVHIAATVVDGLFAGFEFFAGDEFPAALARFDELGAATRRVARQPRVESSATRWSRRLGELMNDGGLDEVAEMYAVDVVAIDRRSVVSVPTLRGRAAVRENVKALRDVGLNRVRSEVLAIRGEQLVLQRLVFSTGDGREMTTLGVNEWEEGQVVRRVVFDEDDLEAALEELEERFIAGEGAPHEYMIRRVGDVRRIASATDPAAAFRALHTPDFSVTDHRLLSWPMETVADVVDEVRADRGISAPRTTVFASLEVRGDAVLVTQDDHFVTPEGSEYLKRSLVVTHSVAGLLDRGDFFEPEQHEAARTHFEEAGAETRTPHIDNMAVRINERAMWRGTFDDTYDRTGSMADDLVIEDRRSGVSIGQLHGIEAAVENIEAQDELFGPTTIEPFAVRGERLMLVRTRAVSDSGFELVSLGLFETNDAGQSRAMTFFDVDDLAAAFDALDARHAEIRTDPPSAAERVGLAYFDAFNRRDWDGVVPCFTPDVRVVDHRPIGFPECGLSEYLERNQSIVEHTPDARWCVLKQYFAGTASLLVTQITDANTDGSGFDWTFATVSRSDAAGRYARLEFFPEEGWSEALARFDEWSATGEATAETTEPENRLTRQLRESIALAERGDPTYTDVLADDVVILDRRSGVSAGTITGRTDFAANAHAHFDVFVKARPTVLAVRGERLALVRMEFQADGFVSVRLNLFETNEDGKLVVLVVLDDDALTDAIEELEARHAAIEAPRTPS